MKKALIGIAVVAVIGVAGWAVSSWPPSGAGKATGSLVKPAKGGKMQAALWEDLAQHEDTYLDAYADYFQTRPDEPVELVNAFNELAYNVTGHGGLWRKTVPDKYFGCQANEHMPVCKEFKKMQGTFSRWDKLQEKMLEVGSKREAQKFIRKHGKELQEYLRYYVPTDESFSAVQATPFFTENLSSAM